MLPIEFTNRMKNLLGQEFSSFLTGYESTKYQALRLNPLKGPVDDFSSLSDWSLTPVPWAKNGYYYDGEALRPGKHPYHEAGVYYIQEPSAMAPAEYLEASENDFVLDLCAAPGGKSTQIASHMNQKGLLISNEIHPARAKILSENIERMGIRNAIVTNETPEHLASSFPSYFTKIMVDAPCSGEGMFRKNDAACDEWSPEHVALCADRQDGILDCAASMLCPGGKIVYSTCTFAPEENEGSISRFLDRHPEFSLFPVPPASGFSEGHPEWISSENETLKNTIRLWPHKLHGEGHFVAVLQKAGTLPTLSESHISRLGFEKGLKPGTIKELDEFLEKYIKIKLDGPLVKFGDQIYLLPEYAPSLKGLKVLRPGLHLGTVLKNRFEPSHALALSLKSEDCVYHADLSATDGSASRFINGETFPYEGEKGWYLITVDGYSLGWGKFAGGIMKNHYPKGLRKQL